MVQASGEGVGVGLVQNQALVIKEEVDSVLEEDLDNKNNRVVGLHHSGEEEVVVGLVQIALVTKEEVDLAQEVDSDKSNRVVGLLLSEEVVVE